MSALYDRVYKGHYKLYFTRVFAEHHILHGTEATRETLYFASKDDADKWVEGVNKNAARGLADFYVINPELVTIH